MQWLALVQAITESIWPRTVDGWLGIGARFVILGGVVGWILKLWLGAQLSGRFTDITTQLNGIGGRVTTLENDNTKTCAKFETEIHELKRQSVASEHDRSSIRENIGRLEGLLERVIAQQDKARDERSEIMERLARIEANVNVVPAFTKLGEDLVRAFSRRSNYGTEP